MKRNILLPFGVLAAGILAASVTAQAQVYAQGFFSGGTSYYEVCLTHLPYPPYEYKMTEMFWREDTNGLSIMDVDHETKPSVVSRRALEVQSGYGKFYLPLDSGPPTRFQKEFDLPTLKGSGDFSAMLTNRATIRGARSITNALPVIQESWLYQSRTNEDIAVLDGDHFQEIQSLLEKAYGKPDSTVLSTTPAGGKGRSINYTPGQIGILLNLTVTFDDTTIVSIIGQKQEAGTK